MSATPSSTPGSQALVNLKKQVEQFKVPKADAVRKKPKQKILTEEKYIEEMAKIIQRDFYPDLDRLRAQNQYLDALERKDYVSMEAIRNKYSSNQSSTRPRLMTPDTFETPTNSTMNTPVNANNTINASDTPQSTISTVSKTSTSSGKSKSISEKHSLDSFLQKYTSEDNYSFQEIIETAEEKLRQKFNVLFNEEELSAEKLAKALTLPTIEKQFDEPDPMRKIETWNYKNKNSIMYIPDGVELTAAERIEAVNKKQIIHHSATRLSENPFDNPISSHKNEGNALIKNNLMSNKVDVDGNIVMPGNAAAPPQIRGFDLVKTPSPRPGENFSPLMTWGEIEGTPFRLDGSDTPIRSNAGPSFRINEVSRRENIGLALAEKVGEKMRAQKQKAIDTARKNIGSPFIRSNMERLASMSPAARRLATTKLGVRTPSITPSPWRTPKTKAKPSAGSNKPSVIPGINKTPNNRTKAKNTQHSAVNNTENVEKTPNLTDNLLQIPTKRLKAADFF